MGKADAGNSNITGTVLPQAVWSMLREISGAATAAAAASETSTGVDKARACRLALLTMRALLNALLEQEEKKQV